MIYQSIVATFKVPMLVWDSDDHIALLIREENESATISYGNLVSLYRNNELIGSYHAQPRSN